MKSFIQYYKEARALPRADDRYHYEDRQPNTLHVSDVVGCIRDAYFAVSGTPKTDPPDESSHANFDVGNWIEQGVIRDVLSKGGLLGLPLLASGNVPITLPLPYEFTLKGHMDALLWDQTRQEIVVWDCKTSHGWPTKMFLEEQKPKDNHVKQLALYVHMLQQKGYKARGELLYYMLGDLTWGKLVSCTVKVENAVIHAGGWATIEAPELVGSMLKFGMVDDLIGEARLKLLRDALYNGVPPRPEKQYRYAITREVLAAAATKDLERALEGKKVLGDWEPKYSAWRSLILDIDKPNMKYSPQELALISAELESRTFTKKRTQK